MAVCTSEKAVGYIPGVLGVVQSTLYFIFSIVCIIYYFKDLVVDLTDISFFKAVYLKFLDFNFYYDNSYESLGLLIEPAAFLAFNWVYVFIYLYWLVSSLKLIYNLAIEGEKLRKWMRHVCWAAICVSVVDLMLVIGLGIDYGKTCTNPDSEMNETLCQKAVLPVLIIAGKGFIFWIVNVVFAFFILKATQITIPDDVSVVPTLSTDSYLYDSYRYEMRPNFRLETDWQGNSQMNYSYQMEYVRYR